MPGLETIVLKAIETTEAHEKAKQHTRSRPTCPACGTEPETYSLASPDEAAPVTVMVKSQPCGDVVAFETIIWTLDVVFAGDAAILRRCEVDRKILALHPQADDYRWLCALCREEGQNLDCTYPCDTVRLLAEAYGVSDVPAPVSQQEAP